MRKIDINKLTEPYFKDKQLFDNRFESAIGADIPSAGKLVEEIFNDFDDEFFGVYWWKKLPLEERILISDYLYQCASDIETNLVEAKLHLMEWLSAKDDSNDRIINVVKRNLNGSLNTEIPPSKTPLDDLPNKLEKMHICGFFRSIGSSLDCLGATIIGVLALPCRKSKSLRKGDIQEAQETLKKIIDSGTSGTKLQTDFRDFFQKVKESSGPEDWLEWADQYRNMFVHRGRRITHHQIVRREPALFDSKGNLILRATSTTHLAKYPDRSEIEAFIKGKDIVLNEDAETTLNCIFKSCKNLNEIICERLLSIWNERRNNPNLLEQPQNQWDDKIRPCNFNGYVPNTEPLNADLGLVSPIISRRIITSSVDDKHRNLWNNSKWR